MKQEHEMTPGVLVSVDDMSAGDYKARVAVLEDEVAELTEALKSAREMVADWGAYASEYFREKHGLEKDLAVLDAAIDAALSQQGKAVDDCQYHIPHKD